MILKIIYKKTQKKSTHKKMSFSLPKEIPSHTGERISRPSKKCTCFDF